MWAYLYQQCIECKTATIPHAAKGLCSRCYARKKWHENYQRIQSNPERRKRYNEKQARWQREHKDNVTIAKNKRLQARKQDPNWRKAQSARSMYWQYLHRHKLLPATECELCKSGNKIEAHHDDYSKPLKVRYLCKECHIKAHRLIF